MLIDLVLKGRPVLFFGGGREAELKTEKLLDSGASVYIAAPKFTRALRALAKDGRVKLIETDYKDPAQLLERIKPCVLFVSSGAPKLDEELAGLGRSLGILLCVVDTPRLNDFNMPAIAKIGGIRIGISTGGKSPAMARVLRERLERMGSVIRPEDVLQVELQESIRQDLREAIESPEKRKRLVYRIIRDKKVNRSLKAGDLDAAKERAHTIIKSSKGT